MGTDEHVLLVTTCWWAATAHFAHLLVHAGCRVSALSPQGHAVQAVDGVTLYRQRPYLPIRRIAEVIRHSKPNLIVPADDRAVAYLHRLHKSGTSSERALIERSIGSPEHYDTVLSRVRLLALAQRLGIAVPANTAVASVDDMSRVLQRDRGPWVVKTDGAWSGHGVRIVTSRERAVNAAHGLRRRQQLAPALLRLLIYRDPYWLAASMRRERPELSVQGFVDGWPATLAMFCSGGKVVAATSADVLARAHETGPAVIIKLVDRPDMMAAAHKLADALGLTGFYGLDFMIEQETGRALLIELNPRVTPLVNVRVGKAGDLIAAAIEVISGRRLMRRNEAPGTDLVAHFPLPDDFHPDDPRFVGCIHNRPKGSQALVNELLRSPWPDRRLLARVVTHVRKAQRAIRSRK